MAKEVRIFPCYGRAPIVLTKGMSARALYQAVKSLAGQEIDRVHFSKTEKEPKDPWRDDE